MPTLLKLKNGDFNLEIVVFICGAIVMIFELVGSRIIGPYVGTSLYAWTGLIGVVLASLSLGYYVGGKRSDASPQVEALATLLLKAAVAIALTFYLKDFILLNITSFYLPEELTSVLTALFLFAPASYFLGMVSPYAVRLRIDDIKKAGTTAGKLYSISTAGSIFGTFTAGFYIIPHLGSSVTLIILSGLLIFSAGILVKWKLGHYRNFKNFISILFFVSLTIFLPKNVSSLQVADIDTQYNRILIYSGVDSMTSRPVVNLFNNPRSTTASVFADGSTDLVLDYLKFFRLSSYFVQSPKSALMIGGGVNSYSADFLKSFPDARIDIVEIDPKMTEIAKKYFGLNISEQMTIIHEDGRIYLNKNTKSYDLVFIDAFFSASIPFQLTTVEAVEKVYASLNDKGAVLLNIISTINGDDGKLLRAEYRTYKSIFPQVYLFLVEDEEDGDKVQNIIIVASKSKKTFNFQSPDLQLKVYLDHLWKGVIQFDLPVLTDDFAPVESYRH